MGKKGPNGKLCASYLLLKDIYQGVRSGASFSKERVMNRFSMRVVESEGSRKRTPIQPLGLML